MKNLKENLLHILIIILGIVFLLIPAIHRKYMV